MFLICYFFKLQWGFKYCTSLVFKWLKRGQTQNGPVFKCLNTEQPDNLNTRQMDIILYSYILAVFEWSV